MDIIRLRRLIATPALALACAALFGCASWHNPNLVNQANSDAMLKRDLNYCEQYAEDQVSTAPLNTQRYPTLGMRQEFEDYQVDYNEKYDQDAVFNKCMKSRGWKLQ